MATWSITPNTASIDGNGLATIPENTSDSQITYTITYDDGNGGGGQMTYVVNSCTPYVEIGGLKWARMNIGATKITDTGFYFQWGDISGYTTDQVGSGSGKKFFDWADYKYGNGTSSPGATGMTKYNSTDGKTVLDPSDDGAIANWGGSWRMPTKDEYVALGNAVNTAWTADYQGSGVAGLVCTDKTDSSKTLFFPACGRCYYGSANHVGSYGHYWSSSLDSGDAQYAYGLLFKDDEGFGFVNWQSHSHRFYGFTVRPVIG